MRTNIIYPFVTSIVLSACGTGTECKGSKLIGEWANGDQSDKLSLGVDCSGTSTYCESEFTIDDSMKESSGGGEIEVTKSNGKAGCLSVGKHICGYEIAPFPTTLIDVLYLNCDGKALEYGRL